MSTETGVLFRALKAGGHKQIDFFFGGSDGFFSLQAGCPVPVAKFS